MFPPSILETLRLRLRVPTLDDTDAVFDAYAADPEVTRFMLWRPHTSTEDTRDFLAEAVTCWRLGEDHRPWAIERSTDGAVIGMIGATVRGHSVEVGYVLARACWGQGLIPEALNAVCDAAFEDPAIHRVWAVCDFENVRSARVLEKAGLRFEGILRSYHVAPSLGPEPRDCRLYARVRRDLGPLN